MIGAAFEVLDAVSARHGFTLSFTEFDWGCERYTREGAMMPVDGLNVLREFDSILLGAVGWPGVPDHVSLWGLLIPIRRTFRQYVNLRPIRTFSGVRTPLREAEFDFVVVRENVESECGEAGGRLNRGFPDELAIQESIFTRAGVTRIVDYAFDLAARRRGYLTSATKSNGIVHTMPFWDDIVAERAERHPRLRWDQEHIDALAAKFVLQPLRPDRLDQYEGRVVDQRNVCELSRDLPLGGGFPRGPSRTASVGPATGAVVTGCLAVPHLPAGIQLTHGAVFGSGASFCNLRPHWLCREFGCLPASTSRCGDVLDPRTGISAGGNVAQANQQLRTDWSWAPRPSRSPLTEPPAR